MTGKVLIFVIIVLCRTALPRKCDESKNSRFKEGNIGEIGYFPWLGILRVHFHDAEIVRIALTGLIYIKEKFSIANADDITRIPRHILLTDSKAMFIPTDKQPWFCKVKEFMFHPEYEFATVNTVALVELKPNEEYYFPITPICIPEYSFNASSELYTIGFTDDNKLLEKMIYKLQYVDPALCDEFYDRAGFKGDKTKPTAYQCGFAVNNKENCVWENGMVLTSNSSGKWHLLGLSIKGPGCAAPARFIDLYTYLPWLESAMSLEDVYYPDYARRAFHPAPVKKKKYEYEDIPAHALFRSNNSLAGRPMLSDPYQFDVPEFRFFDVQRIDKDAIIVAKFYAQYEADAGQCSLFKKVIYREITKISGPGAAGVAYFKLTLYDMMIKKLTCVKINIDCHNRSDAVLYYKTYINTYESGATHLFDGTPEEIIKTHPIEKQKTGENPDAASPPVWKPPAHSRPEALQDRFRTLHIPNVNLWVKFEFRYEALLRFVMHGEPFPKPVTTPSPEGRFRRMKVKPKSRKIERNNETVAHVNNSTSFSSVVIVKLAVILCFLLNCV